MIDNSISDPKNKFELIWSCILKVMIFRNFKNFLKFFWIYLIVFFILKWLKRIKKWVYITARWRDGALPSGDVWMCVCVTRGHTCVCVRDVFAWHACVCVTCMHGIINGLGASIIGFKLTLQFRVCYKPDSIPYFIPCGTIFLSI